MRPSSSSHLGCVRTTGYVFLCCNRRPRRLAHGRGDTCNALQGLCICRLWLVELCNRKPLSDRRVHQGSVLLGVGSRLLSDFEKSRTDRHLDNEAYKNVERFTT